MTRLAVVSVLATFAFAADPNLLDQIGADPNAVNGKNVWASQQFEASFAAYDIGVLDNFSVPAPGAAIGSVEAVIGFWNGTANFPNITGYRVEFYTSTAAAAANLVGNAGSAFLPTYTSLVQPWGAAPNLQGKVLLDITAQNIILAPGNYYVAVIPKMDFTGIGQCGVSGSSLGDLNAGQANPGGGFAFPGNYQVIQPRDNAAYRVTAALLPEPASLLLLGALAVLRRRQAIRSPNASEGRGAR